MSLRWNPQGPRKLQEQIDRQTGMVPVNDLFNTSFMTAHTNGHFADLDSMVAPIGVAITKFADLQSNAGWDAFVDQNTA